jgi:hypothetical protein
MTEVVNGTRVPTAPTDALGLVHQVRWHRGSTRPTTVRRAVGLARFAVDSGLDPQLHQFDLTVRAAVDAAARSRLDRAANRRARRTRRSAALADRIAHLRQRAAHAVSDEVVADPVLVADSAAGVIAAHARGGAVVTALLDAGDERPRRTGRAARWTGRLVPWLDALLFGYFVSGVTNVDLTDPMETPVSSAVTAGLTALVVLTVTAFTPWLGRSMRVFKTSTGEPAWGRLGPAAAALLALWGLLLVGLSVTMYVRVQTEAGYAGADPVTATAVAVLLSLAAATLDVYVLLLGYRDGTGATDDLIARGRSVGRQLARSQRLTTKAAALARRRARIDRRAAAAEAAARAKAQREIARGERLLVLGRMCTGVTREAQPLPSDVI